MRVVSGMGTGLNSIPTRFFLMSAVITSVCALAQAYVTLGSLQSLDLLGAVAVAASVVIPALVTFLAARKLTSEIRSLQRSTEAIASGDVFSPVNVNCQCEVGALADSFAKMVERLNANIIRMNSLAHTDAVTGLPNRTVANHLLSLAASSGNVCEGSLFLIDLDNFKRVNDSLGHDAGDELLRHVSARIATEALGLGEDGIESCTNNFGELCSTCPDRTVFARFAGDEFIAIVPGAYDTRAIEEIGRRIVEAASRPFIIQGKEVRIGASVGVARSPKDTQDPTQLLVLADIAMFEAKQTGRNACVMFDQALRERTIERELMESDLRAAIDNRRLQLFYQPKIDAMTLEPNGVEALIRWERGDSSFVPPDRFLPIAESAGLMSALGRVVFVIALEQSRLWSAAGLRIPIAINVSATQFDDALFVPSLLALMAPYDIDPSLIEIEITETTLTSDFESAAERIRLLRDAGVSVAIDDFGIGFSNLSQLSKLPVNTIKIDRSLIESIGVDRRSEAIFKATIQMAHTLGHTTVAEGIETEAQAAFARAARCDAMQGYLYAHPMPAEALEKWISERAAPAIRPMSTKRCDALVA